MCHGPGSLKRMNPDAASEKEAANKENLATKTENTTGTLEVGVIVKDNPEVSEETRKKKT
jgi:hypothetical protein